MKDEILIFLLCFIFIPTFISAQDVRPGRPITTETDSSPYISPYKNIYPLNAVTDNADGTATLNLWSSKGDALIYIQRGSTNAVSGTNLQIAYSNAKSLTPGGNALSATNRACLLIPPGRYELQLQTGTTAAWDLDTDYIDLASTIPDDPGAVIITNVIEIDYSNTGAVVRQTCDDIRITGITFHCSGDNEDDPVATGSNNSFEVNATDNTNSEYRFCYFRHDNPSDTTHGGTITDYCAPVFFISDNAGSWYDCQSDKAGWHVAANKDLGGTFERCQGGDWCWGGDQSGAEITGTFRNCYGGNRCFGGCFNYGCKITSTAVFDNCIAGDKSWALDFEFAGKAYNCRGGEACFGATGSGGVAGKFSGLARDCQAEDGSFGAEDLTGTLIGCRIINGSSPYYTWHCTGATLIDTELQNNNTFVATHVIQLEDNNTKLYGCTLTAPHANSKSIYASSAKNVIAYHCRMNRDKDDNVTNLIGGGTLTDGFCTIDSMTDYRFGDVGLSDDSPHLTFADDDDGSDTAYQFHLDTADTTWGYLQLWRGTDTDGKSFAVNPNTPIWYVDNSNDLYFPTGNIYIPEVLYGDVDNIYRRILTIDESLQNTHSTVSNQYSVALGYNTVASGQASACFGYDSTASGAQAFACGESAFASGDFSVAFGSGQATGAASAAFCYGEAGGNYAMAGGQNTDADGDWSFAMGEGADTSSAADYSFAFGKDFTNTTLKSFMIGWDSPTFTIIDGKVGIGTTAPAQKLHIVDSISDAEYYNIYNQMTIAGGEGHGKGIYNDFTVTGGVGKGIHNRVTGSGDNTSSYSVEGSVFANGASSDAYGVQTCVTAAGASSRGMGVRDVITVSGSGATGYGLYDDLLASATGSSQTLYGGCLRIRPDSTGDNVYGLHITDYQDNIINNPTVEQIGLYIDWSIPGTDANNKRFSIYSASTEESYFAGNIGIGTTSPSVELDVSGDITLSGTLTDGTAILTDGNFTTTGTLGAGATTLTGSLDMQTYDISNVGTFSDGIITISGGDIDSVGDITANYFTGGDFSGDFYLADNAKVNLGTAAPDFSIYYDGADLVINQDVAGDVYIAGASVGIGTTNPGAKLDIDISGGGTGMALNIDSDSTNTLVDIDATALSADDWAVDITANSGARGLYVYSPDDWAVYGLSGSSIGIKGESSSSYGVMGYSSSSYALYGTVADAATNTVSYAQKLRHATSATAAAGFGTGIEFELEDAGGGFDVLAAIQAIETDATAGAEHGALAFLTADIGDDGLAERVRIDEDGNVGIGTTSPGTKLTVRKPKIANSSDVLTNAANAAINIETGYQAYYFMPALVWTSYDSNPTKPKAGIWIKEHTSGSFMFFGISDNYATGITDVAMTIDCNANVGIGTVWNRCGAKLDVGGGTATDIDGTDDLLVKDDAEIDGVLHVEGKEIDIGDAGGFSGIKFDATDTQLEFWIDGAQVGHIGTNGAYVDDVP